MGWVFDLSKIIALTSDAEDFRRIRSRTMNTVVIMQCMYSQIFLDGLFIYTVLPDELNYRRVANKSSREMYSSQDILSQLEG